MERFVKGDIVVIPFPFSDLSGSKRRPAFVLANLPGDDILLCQITSQPQRDSLAITLNSSDFISGNLPSDSFIRPARIFTADKKIIQYHAGQVNKLISSQVVNAIIQIIT